MSTSAVDVVVEITTSARRPPRRTRRAPPRARVCRDGGPATGRRGARRRPSPPASHGRPPAALATTATPRGRPRGCTAMRASRRSQIAEARCSSAIDSEPDAQPRADLLQCRREQLGDDRHRADPTVGQTVHHGAGGQLVAGGERVVEAGDLRRPVPHDGHAWRWGRRVPRGAAPLHLVGLDLVGGAPLHGRQRTFAHPAVGRVIVHAEPARGLVELHTTS